MAELFGTYLAGIKLPGPEAAVYKDECVYSFDTPVSCFSHLFSGHHRMIYCTAFLTFTKRFRNTQETPTGLYVSLSTFLGFGQAHVHSYARHTGNAVFLHIRRERHELATGTGDDALAAADNSDGPEKKITRLAIGVEGGFDPNAGRAKYRYEDHHSVCILSGTESDGGVVHRVAYPDATLPDAIVASVVAILAAESAGDREAKASTTGTWDGEARLNSVHAEHLVQLDNGVQIPPSGWQCGRCELTSNLWLNLTDGAIRCGRRFFDGSGGNEHAAQHYAETGYPLAVKLGTITADGKGDVYSYAEDDMVLDPLLVQHLAHFGIRTAQLEKTEKSMVELELALNERIGEWSLLTESASQLEPVAGPGFTGMRNLGSSCYLNSVMQVVFTVDAFRQRYVDGAERIFAAHPADPAGDFNVQMAKLACGLASGKYSAVVANSLDADAEAGVAPTMFRTLIGRGHAEFATKQQQDAQEFFLHLINLLERNTPRAEPNPALAFRFQVEDRFECGDSGQVKYTQRDEYCLPLPIPLLAATNADEVRAYEERAAEAERTGVKLPADALVRPALTLRSCLEAFGQTELVEQFHSSATGGKTTAKKRTRFGTLPKYLLLQLKKFTLRSDWTAVKLDVSVDVPDVLDLAEWRGAGLQPGETLLPELEVAVPAPPMDAQVLQSLTEMGFNVESCKRAVFFTKNSGLENATQWLMEHIADSDFNDVFVPPGTAPPAKKKTTAKFVADPASVEQLVAMGFSDTQVRLALKECDNSLERAAEYIFTNQAQLETLEASLIGVEEEADEEMQLDNEAAGSTSSETQFDHKGASELAFVCVVIGISLKHFCCLYHRIPTEGVHLAYGFIVAGWPLCVPHSVQRQVGDLQRRQGCHFTESAQRTGIFVHVRKHYGMND